MILDTCCCSSFSVCILNLKNRDLIKKNKRISSLGFTCIAQKEENCDSELG